jgi:hypothetical protein
MWFKAFVLLRLPVSILLLLAFWALGVLGVVNALVALVDTIVVLVYLGVVTANLWRLRLGALRQTGLLLAMEWAGAVIWVGARDIATGPNWMLMVNWACVVVVVWVLPNALLLYRWRRLFAEPAKEKPGL